MFGPKTFVIYSTLPKYDCIFSKTNSGHEISYLQIYSYAIYIESEMAMQRAHIGLIYNTRQGVNKIKI